MTCIDVAYEKLTDEQKRRIDATLKTGEHTVSAIACKLSLTRSFVQSYIRSKQ
jgi:transposase-like protein